jgi:hypothetical protein
MDQQQQLHHVHTTRDWVAMRHPVTGDVQEVEATPENLTKLLIQGYVQSKPATPAKGN